MELEKIIQIAKRRGIIFPSSEIYGGLAGFFDYGNVGLLLKRKIENSWREFFVKSEEKIFEVETSLIMHERVWEASGHLKSFIDPITQCKKCNSFYRADNLIQESTNRFVEGLKIEDLTKIIEKEKLKCPKCKGDLSEVKIFNLMLSTNVGPASGNKAYLRPETAQGIFVNFKNLLTSTRASLPFGVAQVGKSYRNEISPRQWIMRLREFSQMEIEYFFNPNKAEAPDKNLLETKIRILTREAQKEKNPKEVEIKAKEAVEKRIIPNEIMAYFMVKEFIWYQRLGIPREALRFRHMLPEETPHYSSGNFDLEIKFDFGWREVVGNAYRTDHDLSSHMKHSGEDFGVVDGKDKIVPHVFEPSFGMERTIYAVLLYCFKEGKERGWSWFAFPPNISPYSVGVFPLVNKDGLPEKAKEVYTVLKNCFDAYYDESGSIGKRYARADEIGVPYCVTIDYDTLRDSTVTIRNRDDCSQARAKISNIVDIVFNLINSKIKFDGLKKNSVKT
ncbi:MAG: glycine--tRNA ligase [Candidatus Aenigmatarchaeota archaeon]